MFSTDDAFSELIETVQVTDLEDYGTFEVTKLENFERQLSLECQVSIEDNNSFHRRWLIVSKGVKRSKVEMGFFDKVKLEEEHILLREYVEPVLRLGFRGRPDNLYSLLGSLYKEHLELAGEWVSLSAFLMNREVYKLIESGFGTFAEGPASFILAYQNAFKAYDIETSLTGERRPSEWNGSSFNDFPKLKALLMNDSFIVAEEFTAKKI